MDRHQLLRKRQSYDIFIQDQGDSAYMHEHMEAR